MPKRTITIDQIGEVILSKRRGATNLRISVTSTGKVRVSMPYWTPYAAGIAFAKSRKDWINKHLADHQEVVFEDGDLIGKAHRLNIYPAAGKRTSSRITDTRITIRTDLASDSHTVQRKALQASEKALRSESEKLLPQRLELLASKHGFSYREVKIRKLTSRWGSCSSKKNITLSFYLIQLPWQFIDYVLLHELVHTEHLHHGKDFWDRFEQVMPGARQMRKEMRRHHPRITPLKIRPITLEKRRVLA